MIKELFGSAFKYDGDGLRLKKIYIALAFALFSIARLSGDIAFSGLNISGEVLIIWQSITSLIITGTIAFYLFANPLKIGRDDTAISHEDFQRELSTIFALMLIMIAGNMLIPDYQDQRFATGNAYEVVSVLLTSIYGMIVSLLTYRFLYKWYNIRKHKKTNAHIKILAGLIILAVTIEFVSYVFEFGSSEPKSFLHAIIFILTAIITLFTTRKNSWIASLARPSKWKLFWLSFCGVILSFIVMQQSFGSDSNLHFVLSEYVTGSSMFMGLACFILMLYLIRIFLATIASFPTTGIVEKKTSEISSLTYLNKYVADSINQDPAYLLDTVARLALHASEADSDWAEIYEDGKIKIASAQNIDPAAIMNVHDNETLQRFLKSIEKPFLVESVPEHPEIKFLAKLIPVAQSIIIIPLFSGRERIGTLVVAHHEEYGLDHEDVNVLAAFSDNVNVALENSRLFKDSLEKEKYKNEMLLARSIQQKLLPEELPRVDNYSISAFSMPAAEVGGDYYDMVYLSDGSPCLLIGDVSGKGISAAFYMAQLKGIVLSHAPFSKSPADLLKKINNTLYGNMDKQLYITLSAVSLMDKHGTISISRAGHMPIIIKSNNFVSMYIPKGIGIGLADSGFFDSSIEEIEIGLNKGDSCLLFTDGLNELNSYNNKQLGFEPLKEVMVKNSSLDASDLTESLRELISMFPEKNSQHDDMTVVGIVYSGDNNKILRA